MTHPDASLDGRWVLLTGAGKRIGACIARTLHDAGANIAIHYRNSATGAESLAHALNERRAGSTLTAQADLGRVEACERLVADVTDRTGGLDVLINNASSFYPTPLGQITEADWEDLLGSNLKAPLFLSQAAMPHLRAARGSIVNIVDIHANRPLRNHPVYGPAKAGLAMLTRSLARDLAPDVRVNGVSPGAILWPEDEPPENVKQSVLKQIPMKRVGDPQDIANCVLYLTTAADYVTGQIIAVDGGRSIGW